MIGAVLCGGKSRRMGSPKALLRWGDTDLLGHALQRLARARLPAVCLGPADWATSHGAAALPDAFGDAGPLAGVLSALRQDDVFVISVDMPLLTADEISALADYGRREAALTLPAEDGMLRALCGYWPAALAASLEAYLAGGGRRVIGFAQTVAHRFLAPADLRRIGIAPEHLDGLNTPDEYRAALAAADLGQGGDA
ncbi:MAG: molybdenum cofactor guanylyltransferase [Thermaerobacter sp.]|nr:molybdenum cofactor guanylyltransferase [Thermaerobacter sp.]